MIYKEIEKQVEKLEEEFKAISSKISSEESPQPEYNEIGRSFIRFVNRVFSINKKVILKNKSSNFNYSIGLNPSGLSYLSSWRTNLENIENFSSTHAVCEVIFDILKEDRVADEIRDYIKPIMIEYFDKLRKYIKENKLCKTNEYNFLGSLINMPKSYKLTYQSEIGSFDSFNTGRGYYGTQIRANERFFSDVDEDEKSLNIISNKSSDLKLEQLQFLQLILNDKEEIIKTNEARNNQINSFMLEVRKFKDFFEPLLNILEAVDNL